jgi:hypothetical protein
MLFSWCVLAVLTGVYTNSPAASAGVLYDNLGATTLSSDAVSGPAAPLADSFSTPAVATALTDVNVLLDGSSLSDGFSQVDLLSDARTAPGTLLLSLGIVPDVSLSSTPIVFDLPLAVPFVLAADSRYWIEVSSPNGSTANWDWSPDISGPGVANEFFYFGGQSFPNLGAPYQMQVNGDPIIVANAVPEPSGFVVLLSALAVLGILRRHRRS